MLDSPTRCSPSNDVGTDAQAWCHCEASPAFKLQSSCAAPQARACLNTISLDRSSMRGQHHDGLPLGMVLRTARPLHCAAALYIKGAHRTTTCTAWLTLVWQRAPRSQRSTSATTHCPASRSGPCRPACSLCMLPLLVSSCRTSAISHLHVLNSSQLLSAAAGRRCDTHANLLSLKPACQPCRALTLDRHSSAGDRLSQPSGKCNWVLGCDRTILACPVRLLQVV
jgi:hypothetical protein